MVGGANECAIVVESVATTCILGSGSMVSTVSKQFYKEHLHHVPIEDLHDLKMYGSGDHVLPYRGLVFAQIGFDNLSCGLMDVPLLVPVSQKWTVI